MSAPVSTEALIGDLRRRVQAQASRLVASSDGERASAAVPTSETATPNHRLYDPSDDERRVAQLIAWLVDERNRWRLPSHRQDSDSELPQPPTPTRAPGHQHHDACIQCDDQRPTDLTPSPSSKSEGHTQPAEPALAPPSEPPPAAVSPESHLVAQVQQAMMARRRPLPLSAGLVVAAAPKREAVSNALDSHEPAHSSLHPPTVHHPTASTVSPPPPTISRAMTQRDRLLLLPSALRPTSDAECQTVAWDPVTAGIWVATETVDGTTSPLLLHRRTSNQRLLDESLVRSPSVGNASFSGGLPPPHTPMNGGSNQQQGGNVAALQSDLAAARMIIADLQLQLARALAVQVVRVRPAEREPKSDNATRNDSVLVEARIAATKAELEMQSTRSALDKECQAHRATRQQLLSTLDSSAKAERELRKEITELNRTLALQRETIAALEYLRDRKPTLSTTALEADSSQR